MRVKTFWVVGFVLVSYDAHAAENEKLVETALRNHAEAVAKADQVRLKAVEKSRDETISQLVKLATRAYGEKDRVAETGAWKAVLRLDRSHERARRYFNDLGILEKVLAELPDDASAVVTKLPRFAGQWRCLFQNGVEDRVRFDLDGTAYFLTKEGKVSYKSKVVVDGDSVIAQRPTDCVNRYTIAGRKLLMEQWCPASKFPGTTPNGFGYAVRDE